MAKVRESLDRCLASGPSAQDLLALEAADRELAWATRNSLVWEAYRIAINGLSLKNIRQHLELRSRRFEQALQEEWSQTQAQA